MLDQPPAQADRAKQMATASHVLARQALVTAFGHVSVRAGANNFVITPPVALGSVTNTTELITVEIDANVLPQGAPGETWIHVAIYRARPDVRSVVRAQPPSSHPASVASAALYPIHGQGAWLGRVLPVHEDAKLVRSGEAGHAVAQALGDARAVLLRGNGAVTVGTDPYEAATLQWVVEQSCAHMLRAAALAPRPLQDQECDAWFKTWPELWPRLWSYLETHHE
ncbi:MAG: class II aldolase/adducin family protein [Burkholderiaceae bacterium]